MTLSSSLKTAAPRTIRQLAILPEVEQALRFFETNAAAITDEQVRICSVPATPFAEQQRAESAVAERDQAMEHVATLEEQLATITADRDTSRAAALEQQHRAAELDTAIVSARTQLESMTTMLTETRTAQDVSTSALQAAISALERERDAARAGVATQETAIQQANDRIALLEQEIRSIRRLEADAMATSIAAHRDLIVDVMRRMVERETDRARRAQQTPERLQRWLETFYDGHADLMRQALLPAIRVHLAFIRSDEDPVEATRRLVDMHVHQSERQIRAVLEGDADDYGTSLPALLYRWDTERPTELATILMTKEIEYAGRL